MDIKFVEYSGKWPNLCRGKLTLEINGERRIFPKGILCSCGTAYFDDDWESHITEGKWIVEEKYLPEDLKDFSAKIEECVSNNVPYGCCGGCL